MENRIYVSIPLDALIVSGITSDCAVQISAVDGAILIERCDDDCEECCCDCICEECWQRPTHNNCFTQSYKKLCTEFI